MKESLELAFEPGRPSLDCSDPTKSIPPAFRYRDRRNIGRINGRINVNTGKTTKKMVFVFVSLLAGSFRVDRGSDCIVSDLSSAPIRNRFFHKLLEPAEKCHLGCCLPRWPVFLRAFGSRIGIGGTASHGPE